MSKKMNRVMEEKPTDQINQCHFCNENMSGWSETEIKGHLLSCPARWKPIQMLLNTIPKEHKSTVKKICAFHQRIGREEVLEMVSYLGDLPPYDFNAYSIYHDKDVD